MVNQKITFNQLIDIPSEKANIVTVKDSRNRTQVYRIIDNNRVFKRAGRSRSWAEVTEKGIKSTLVKQLKAFSSSGVATHIVKGYISVPLFLGTK